MQILALLNKDLERYPAASKVKNKTEKTNASCLSLNVCMSIIDTEINNKLRSHEKNGINRNINNM